MVLPINKKRYRKDPVNYRRIKVLNSSYKIYTTVLNEKLKKIFINFFRRNPIWP